MMNINHLKERYNSLSKREQNMSVLTLFVVVLGSWFYFFYNPYSLKQKQLGTQLVQLDSQRTALLQLIQQIENRRKQDPNTANRQRLKQIKRQLKQQKQRLSLGDKKFVSASVMADVLARLLKQNNGLKLTHLETLPVTTLPESDANKKWIYRHGLSLTFEGNYFKTLAYLKKLEAQPWRINWGEIHYQVKIYPQAETNLRIYTLSFEENWLGL